jgi:phosphonatase-like hydrolase
VVLDLAGTTVYDDDAVAHSLVGALTPFRPVTLAEANALMGIPKPIAIQTLVPELTADKVQQAFDDFRYRMKRHYQSETREIPGATETFRVMREAGIRVALDTGFDHEITDLILDRLNWREAVDDWISSDEVTRGRPSGDMVRALMARAGIENPAEVAKVGDTPADIGEGQAAGCGWVIGVLSGTHTAEQLMPLGPTQLVSDVTELRGLWAI